MSDPRSTGPPVDPERDPGEREQLARLAERLERERPVPRPAFRGDLGRHLMKQLEPRRVHPRRLRAMIFAYAGSGLGLLAVAALGVAGVGPLAA